MTVALPPAWHECGTPPVSASDHPVSGRIARSARVHHEPPEQVSQFGRDIAVQVSPCIQSRRQHSVSEAGLLSGYQKASSAS